MVFILVLICTSGSRYIECPEATTEITIYSNLNRIALYKDGVFLEEKEGGLVFKFEVEIDDRHIFEARSGELAETISICKIE